MAVRRRHTDGPSSHVRRIPKPELALDSTTARRLAITKQKLAGDRPSADQAGLFEVSRALGCIQIDPISVVARTHLLVPFSRVGVYDVDDYEQLIWKERRLFHYLAHAASLVLTEDFPLHAVRMRRYRRGEGERSRRMHEWAEGNSGLKRHILRRLRREGPLRTGDFDDRSAIRYRSTGWNAGRNVDRMLDHLWTEGRIMIAGRSGAQRLWDLTERCLPEWTPRQSISQQEAERRAVEIALGALGVATARHIREHFTRGLYSDVPAVLDELRRRKRVIGARLETDGGKVRDDYFLHVDDIDVVEGLQAADWSPRTTLLSPFDNLIADRERTRALFDFDFALEIYVPKAKRKWGYYVLPVLHGDRLIARIDPVTDRANEVLRINAIHLEANAPDDVDTRGAVRFAIEQLARFVGVRSIEPARTIPPKCRRYLES